MNNRTVIDSDIVSDNKKKYCQCDYFLIQAAKFEKKDEGFEFGEREEDKGDNVINIKVYYTLHICE